MLFTNTISLVLALAPAALFAAPTSNLVPGTRLAPRTIDQLDTVGSLCDLSDAKLPQGKHYHSTLVMIQLLTSS
jgi:hypothetical protein